MRQKHQSCCEMQFFAAFYYLFIYWGGGDINKQMDASGVLWQIDFYLKAHYSVGVRPYLFLIPGGDDKQRPCSI